MKELLTVRTEHNLWTCVCEGRRLEAIGFVDLIGAIAKQLGVRKFSVTFDCDGRAVDGVSATFDFGAPDTYVPA